MTISELIKWLAGKEAKRGDCRVVILDDELGEDKPVYGGAFSETKRGPELALMTWNQFEREYL